MKIFDKNHDPRKNGKLLIEITGKKLDAAKVISETEEIFQQCSKNEPVPRLHKVIRVPFSKKFTEGLFRLLAKPFSLLEPTKLYVDSTGNVYPEWKQKLDAEYENLLRTITREVNIEDFGGIGDGKTDNTAAFKKALGDGRVKVKVPEGTFITKGIYLPSWTFLVGAGKGKTIIKLHKSAAKGTRLITNANHWKGNHHVSVQGMSLDWNVERLGVVKKTSTWGNHSSCLTYANVTFGWVKDLEAINPGLHCFDISSTLYNYAGDGFRAKGGSQYVWLDTLNGYGFGDDGITTHHSDYILITYSHMCDPSGRAHQRGVSNSNGIEIDDGSRNVVLVNNSSARCFGGIEVKAHQNSSAASNIQIAGHISVNDNRSYNFRHIGHHKSTDTVSKSAYNITAVNLAAIRPIFTDLYKDSTPRGLVVSGYKNVVINHFTLIGDPDYDYRSNPIIALQYRARNVVLNNLSVRDFKSASADIKAYGGKNRADSILINHVEARDSASKVIDIGKGIQDIRMEHINQI
ncbi:glycosyl hydrolase family 28-related protein [Neobacillus niacini]|uniref:glycosyl hydrolase family 28-related protein n=1 Tax=Neobacillus niacini TaxID=86668 RepID=UPI00052F4E2C|nr:glycosyl hydrolase family 28-related protein [Neobacillus niacini]KGM46445.1 pectate lyase [Neobacillus niacini]MEC1524310.1 glycosyl hydrolase family 28-related protein [Neobacillus niacini]